MKTIEINVTYKYTIEVDEDNYIVKEYDSEEDLVGDLVGYRFSTLPVINDGVNIVDIEAVEWKSETV